MSTTQPAYSVRSWLRGFRRSPAWQGWMIGNIHHAIMPPLGEHEVHVQQRLDHPNVIDLTFRHPEQCVCPEAVGAPRVEPPAGA